MNECIETALKSRPRWPDAEEISSLCQCDICLAAPGAGWPGLAMAEASDLGEAWEANPLEAA